MFSAFLLLLAAFVAAADCNFHSFLLGAAIGSSRKGRSRSTAASYCKTWWVTGWQWPFLWREKQCGRDDGPVGYLGDYRGPERAGAKLTYREYVEREWGKEVRVEEGGGEEAGAVEKK